MEGGEELEALMPAIQGRALALTSPGDTNALREYMLGAASMRPLVPLAPANAPRREQLQLRKGTGREVPKRPFAIRISAVDIEEERAKLRGEAAQLDPEELKDALLLQAKVQRAAMLRAALRPGGKRPHVRRPFTLVLAPVVLPEPEPEPTTATPGEAVNAGRLAHTAGSSQRGCAPVSAGRSSGGWATPMEGVPERLLLTARARAPPATVSRSRGRIVLTPAGYTPLEGIPERLHLLTAQRAAPGRSAIISNGTPGGSGSVDSPVDGLVQEGARRSSAGDQPAPGDEFAFAPTAEEADGSGDGAELLKEAGAGPSPSGRALSAGGFPSLDDGAFSPSRQLAEACAQTGLSLKSRQSEGEGSEPEPEAATEAAPEAAPEAAAEEGALTDAATEHGPPGSMALLLDDDDDDGGGGAGGYDDGWGDEPGGAPDEPAAWHQQEQPEQQQPVAQPGPTSEAEAGRKQRRGTRNPGVRLRNELGKRKSLVARPDVGMREVAPGLRRSTRQREPPLKWWLNENKEYAREHTTLPTIKDVRHVNPNTPWRTVADPLQSFKRRRKRAARAPTPHELELEAAAAAEVAEEAATTADEAEEAAASPAVSDAEAEQRDVVPVHGEQEQQPAEPSDGEGAAPQAQRPPPPGRRVTRSQITASVPATRSRAQPHALPKGLESTGKSKRRRR